MILLILGAVGFVLTTYDDADYRHALTELVAKFTDYTLIVEGPFRVNVSFSPSLSVSSVTLSPEDSDDIFSFDHLEFQFALRPLLDGVFQLIRLDIDGGKVIWVTKAEEDTDDDAFFDDELVDLFPNIILERVSIRNIALTIKQEKSDKEIRAKLDNFSIRDVLNHKPLSFSGKGTVSGTPLSLSGQLGALTNNIHDEAYPLNIEIHSQPINLALSGTIDDLKRKKGADFLVKADIADVAPALDILKLQIPLAGRLQAQGQVQGDLDSLALNDLNISVNHQNIIALQIAGSVDDLLGMQGGDFLVKADIADVAPALDVLKLQIPLAGRLQGQGQVRGDLHALSLSNLDVSVNHQNVIALQIAGSVEDLLALQGVKTKISGAVSEPELLKWFLPVDLQAISNLTFFTSVASQGAGYLISDLTAQGTNSHGLQVDMSGHGLLDNFKAEQPFGDLDILIKVDSPDTASVQGYLLDDLPELGRAVGTVRLTAPSYKDLAVEDIDVQLGQSPELHVSATGRIDKIPLSDLPNSGIALQLEATAIRTERIAYLFNYPLPEVGPVSLKAHFLGSKSQSEVTDVTLEAGRTDDLILTAQGGLILGDFSTDDYLRGVSLTVDFSSPPSSLSSLVNFDLSRVASLKGNGIVSKEGDKGTFEGKLQVGQTELTTKLTGVFTSEIPQLEGRIAAPIFHLSDFGLQADKSEHLANTTADAPNKRKKANKPTNTSFLFDRDHLSFDFLHTLDLSLDVDLHQFGGEKSRVDSVEMGLRLKDGQLVIDPVSFIFEGGSIEGNAFVDGNLSPPQMNLEITADDVDLGNTLSHFKKDVPVEGNFNLYADISSSGFSPHDIAANLLGDVEMVLDQGRIPRPIMDLLAMDLLGWSISKTIRRESYAEINCGVVGLQADEGLLTTKSFIFDSSRVLLTGGGTVDLGAETIDMVLHPKKKKRFWSTITPVHIKGQLADPSVKALPTTASGIAASGVMLVPQFFLPATGLMYLWEQMSQEKGSKLESPCLQKLMEGQ